MKKFLEFISVLFGPLLSNVFMFFFGMLMFGWVLSFFGLLVFFAPSPTWLRWTVGVFDSFCLIMIINGWIYGAWEKVYKQN
jgi:hypothetical protein